MKTIIGTILGTLTLVLALSTPALAVHDEAAQTDSNRWSEDPFFPDMTSHKNITWEMFQKAHPNMTRADFDRIDSNRDGVISGNEFNGPHATMVRGHTYGDTDEGSDDNIGFHESMSTHANGPTGDTNSNNWEETPFFVN